MTQAKARIELGAVVIRFSGDSGDGMQTVGEKFTDNSALLGNDISTYPDFPAEIRAPQGTLPGVSGFQLHFGSVEILTPGDQPDVLVAMNPAALKVNLTDLKEKGLLIINTGGFTKENIKKAGYQDNPLDDPQLETKYLLVKVDVTELTKEALKESDLKHADKIKCKNFWALGFTFWLYNRSLESTCEWIKNKWAHNPKVVDANTKALKAGFYFGEISEVVPNTYVVNRAPVKPGRYRKISGNEAAVLGIIAASERGNIEVVYGSYPITPASSILEGLAKHKNFNIKTVQAEDEIAAIGVAIGASFTGRLGITGTSGPGVCLKSEAMGLAVMTELPLVIINVQRGGPSTGLPTKTEQADLLQAMFGRNGESPMPILAANSPSDCFDTVFEAARIAVEYTTPVMVLSDNYIANGSEPWLIPNALDLPTFKLEIAEPDKEYKAFKRNPDTLARQIAPPGIPGLEHRIGGLEKSENGMVSYDSDNHSEMIRLRAKKVDGVAKSYPKTEVFGSQQGNVLVIGWGGSFGAIRSAVKILLAQKYCVGQVHLRHINPFPNDLAEILEKYEKIFVPELNLGQIDLLLRAKYLRQTISYQKVNAKPFSVQDLIDQIKSIC